MCFDLFDFYFQTFICKFVDQKIRLKDSLLASLGFLEYHDEYVSFVEHFGPYFCVLAFFSDLFVFCLPVDEDSQNEFLDEGVK